jgi:hypothetical protein
MADLAGYAEVPIYLSGLGTVQAFNSVLIKSRVDGQILKMDFAEGRSFSDGFAGRQIRSQGAPRARLRRCCRRASPERRVVLGSANSPSQSGDVDAVARAVVGALLDVTRHAHVALDRSVLGLNAFRDVHRRPKPGPCRVTHSLTRGLFHGVAVESSAIPEVM